MATRFFTGADGQTHIGHVPMQIDSSGNGTARKTDSAYLVRLKLGYFETWHNAGSKRYIVVLSGSAQIVTRLGEKLTMLPGQLYIAEDLTGKGHTFHVTSKSDFVALFVNYSN
jgi:hypothetical protein